MAHHVARGDYVACIVLTHGARVHDEVISNAMFHKEQVPDKDEMATMIDERSDVKADEVRAACKILGVNDVIFFGADDAILLVTEQVVRRLARVLREMRPDIVITHFPKESDGMVNPHAVAGQIVMHAIQFAQSVEPGDNSPPHSVAQIFFFGEGAAGVRRNLWHAVGGFYNDIFINIEDVIEKKLAALDCMVSQGYAGAYARKRIETSDGSQGTVALCAYAEGFIAMNPETHYYLPVTQHALDVARSSDHERMNRYVYRIPLD